MTETTVRRVNSLALFLAIGVGSLAVAATSDV
jgi:hypothetical protein